MMGRRGRRDHQVDAAARAPGRTKIHLNLSIGQKYLWSHLQHPLCNGAHQAPLLAYCDWVSVGHGHHGEQRSLRLAGGKPVASGMSYQERPRRLHLEIELGANALMLSNGATACSVACRERKKQAATTWLTTGAASRLQFAGQKSARPSSPTNSTSRHSRPVRRRSLEGSYHMLFWRRPRRLPPDIQLELDTLLSALRGKAPLALGTREEFGNAKSPRRAGVGRLRQWLADLSSSRRRWV